MSMLRGLRHRVARVVALILLPLALAACGGERVFAPDEDVTRALYVHDGPTEITLYTMVSNRTGQGGHSALLINGSHRVLFDPAGSWWHRTSPERHDVFYGITPTLEAFFIDYHARETYHVVIQRVSVPPQVAEQAIRLAERAGPVPNAYCANAVSGLLRELPGFETLPRTFFPVTLSEAFGRLPGVRTERVFDDSPDASPEERLAAQAAL